MCNCLLGSRNDTIINNVPLVTQKRRSNWGIVVALQQLLLNAECARGNELRTAMMLKLGGRIGLVDLEQIGEDGSALLG